MRVWILVLLGGLLAVGAIIYWTPLRYAVFPVPLTTNQQAILRRATTGLAVFATKSPTAKQYYQEARRSGRWTRFISVIPIQPALSEPDKAFSITVMSKNTVGALAYYLHLAKSICFIEASCESLGEMPLGLTFAHELGHRFNSMQRTVKISDLPTSQPFREGEARSQFLEATILREYTAGRFDVAVDQHLKAYWKLTKRARLRCPVNALLLPSDFRWVKQEFGAVTLGDQRQIARVILMAAGVRKRLAGQTATQQDSLDAAIAGFSQ